MSQAESGTWIRLDAILDLALISRFATQVTWVDGYMAV